MECEMWDCTVVAVMAICGCWILMMPNDETLGSNRCLFTLVSLAILITKGVD